LLAYAPQLTSATNLDPCVSALAQQHINDLLRAFIAEELAQLLLVVLNAVFFDQRNEIAGRVARQRGFAEVWICRKKVRGVRVNISEVAAATAGDRDLLADTIGVL